MKVGKICSTYCIGCGLCQSELDVNLPENNKGYIKPSVEGFIGKEEFLKNVCPIMDDGTEYLSCGDIWGDRIGIYAGFSNDSEIRQKASSGGVLTELAIYLLEAKLVDGIIQISADKNDPTATAVCVSTDKQQVLQCCGSRYSISTVWKSLNTIIDVNKTYAAIAKPCDIKALRRLQQYNSQYLNIKYLLSFFCAGLPSKDAQTELLKQLSCDKSALMSLTYRGNGWPGYTTAIDKDGQAHTMKYANAWGDVLGRDIHPFCRMCMDGIGEAADISCGDGWYIQEDGTPDFTEHEGRNIVFTRTKKGEELLRDAVRCKKISIEEWNHIDELEVIQNYQYRRKATMRSKLWAYRLFFRPIPGYSRGILKKYSGYVTDRDKMRIFLGTVKRIIQRRI